MSVAFQVVAPRIRILIHLRRRDRYSSTHLRAFVVLKPKAKHHLAVMDLPVEGNAADEFVNKCAARLATFGLGPGAIEADSAKIRARVVLEDRLERDRRSRVPVLPPKPPLAGLGLERDDDDQGDHGDDGP